MTKGTVLRSKALDILLGYEEKGRLPENFFSPEESYLDPRDRAFIKLLTEGTVERQITLDYVIDRFSRVGVRKMKPVIRNILRMGVYQMLFMDSVPVYTACDESVKLTRKRHLGPLSGFVNGVLREIGRSEFDISAIEDPAIRHSVPDWIYKLFVRDFGEERAEGIISSFLKNRPVYVRINAVRTTGEELKRRLSLEGITVKEVPDNEEAFIIQDFGDLTRSEAFKEGLFSVQDLSSMSIGKEIREILDKERPDSFLILDLCASPGGKACHGAEILKCYEKTCFPEEGDTGRFKVIAGDISRKKTALIDENIKRLGLDNINAVIRDARTISVTPEKADLIIADLPCSGLGVVGRKNEIKYRVKEEDIISLQSLQREILKASANSLKRQGTLIFSVCTIDREETFMQTEWIRDTLGLTLIKDRMFIPGEGDADGFYFAVFK